MRKVNSSGSPSALSRCLSFVFLALSAVLVLVCTVPALNPLRIFSGLGVMTPVLDESGNPVLAGTVDSAGNPVMEPVERISPLATVPIMSLAKLPPDNRDLAKMAPPSPTPLKADAVVRFKNMKNPEFCARFIVANIGQINLTDVLQQVVPPYPLLFIRERCLTL